MIVGDSTFLPSLGNRGTAILCFVATREDEDSVVFAGTGVDFWCTYCTAFAFMLRGKGQSEREGGEREEDGLLHFGVLVGGGDCSNRGVGVRIPGSEDCVLRIAGRGCNGIIHLSSSAMPYLSYLYFTRFFAPRDRLGANQFHDLAMCTSNIE